VEQALKGSPDVGAAQAALRQAHELYSAQWTALFPPSKAMPPAIARNFRPRP
jgi:outer membrane protein TolC